jgi:hypothetical protein
MRLLPIVFVSLLGISGSACSKSDDSTGSAKTTDPKAASADKGGDKDKEKDKDKNATPAPTGPTSTPIEKKPVDKRPLPKLVQDSGGGTGKPQWAVGFGGLETETPRDMAVSAAGEVYVVGYFDEKTEIGGTKLTAPQLDPNDPLAVNYKTKSGKMKPTSDAFLAKIGADGKIAWARSWGAKRDEDAKGVVVRGDTIVVVGNFLDEFKLGELPERKSVGSDDVFVAAFTKDGDPKWTWSIGGLASDGANTIAATPDGGYIVGGSFSDTITFRDTKLTSRGGTDAMLIKLNSLGDPQWIKTFGGGQNDTINHVAVDGQGSIYVQAQYKYKANFGDKELVAAGGAEDDLVLAKYDSNGDHIWSQSFGTPFEDSAGGIAVDPAGNVVMVGGFERAKISFGQGDEHTPRGTTDMFIARFDSSGKLTWAKSYGGDRDDVAMGVAMDAAGNIITTGWFTNTVEFGKQTMTSKFHNKDVFALKLDTKGEVVWARQWGDKDHDQGRVVALDDKGNPYVAGIFRFTLDVATPAIESARLPDDRIPKPDVFVVKLDR